MKRIILKHPYMDPQVIQVDDVKNETLCELLDTKKVDILSIKNIEGSSTPIGHLFIVYPDNMTEESHWPNLMLGKKKMPITGSVAVLSLGNIGEWSDLTDKEINDFETFINERNESNDYIRRV